MGQVIIMYRLIVCIQVELFQLGLGIDVRKFFLKLQGRKKVVFDFELCLDFICKSCFFLMIWQGTKGFFLIQYFDDIEK